MSIKNLIDILPEEYKSKVLNSRPELIDWDKFSKEYKLSELFIDKFKDYVNWDYISAY